MKRNLASTAVAVLLGMQGACDKGGGPPGSQADLQGAQDGFMPSEIRFESETVDPAASGAGVAIVVDAQGAPHVLYLAAGQEMSCTLGMSTSKYTPAQLWHATRAAGQPFTKLAVSGNDAEVNGLSAALDPKTGRPVVTYQGGAKGASYCGGTDMMLARFGGAAWSRATVADKSTAGTGSVEKSGDVVGAWSALAIGKSGTWSLVWTDLHFGFAELDLTRADLEFAAGADGALRPGEGVGTDVNGWFNAITLDAQERPIVAFSSYKFGGLSVSVRQGQAMWKKTDIVMGGSKFPPSLATAPKSGRMGLAYYDTTQHVLRLSESMDALSWPFPDAVDHDGDVGRAVSLRYDSADRPVLAYYSCGGFPEKGCDPLTDALRVARRDDSGAWRVGTVDTGGDGACGAVLALALGPDDKAHVAYQCNVFDHQSGQFQATVKYAAEK